MTARKRPVRGQALVPVLFVVLILTALAITVTTTGRQEARAAGNALGETQQYFAARGAVLFAAANLQQATNGGTTPPSLSPPPDTDANGWTQLGDAWYKVDIIDTAARLNINTADAASLAKLPGIQNDTSIAAAIVDWRDSDDMPTAGAQGTGAESDYYQALNPPYAAKNAPFDTVDELLLVRGITPALLYGAATSGATDNQSGTQAGGASGPSSRSRQAGGPTPPSGPAPPSGSADSAQGPAVDTSQSTVPLAELITTYSRERNVASDGTPRVNVLTADQQALQRVGIPAEMARRLVQQRGSGGTPITSIADLINVGFSRALLQQVGDKITVTDAQYRDGLININKAPAEVLATIPGVDTQTYNAIIAARQNGTVFTGLNDIFQLTALNYRQFQALVDHVCTKSSIYLVRVRVRVNGSQRVYAAQALVELASQAQAGNSGAATAAIEQSAARILQWREVPRTPGWSSWTAPPSYSASGTTTTPSPNGGTLGSPQ